MNKRTLYHGEYLSMLSRDGWEYASRANARAVVVLVPVTDGGEIVLVEQYRKPVDARVLELPAGLVGDGEDADESLETAAARELEEETGYRAAVLEPVLTCPSSAGMSDEMITFFLARGLERVGPGGGDASEELDVHPVPLARVDEWLSGKLADGVLLDPKIYTALHWLATGVTPATARG